MSFNTGVITSATQPAKDLMDTLGGIIDAHAAFEFVEEVVGTGTNVARVYKCLGSVNGFNDFYIALARTSLTSRVVLIAGEGYDSGTKRFTNPVIYQTSTAITIGAGREYVTPKHVANDQINIGSVVNGSIFCSVPGTGPAANANGVGVNTTGFTYWISVTNKMLFIGTSTDSGWMYAGLFESFHAVPTVEAFPLVVGVTGPINGNVMTAAQSRATGLAPSGSVPYPFSCCSGLWTPVFSPQFITGNTKEKITGKFWVGRAFLYSWPGNSATFPRANALIGLLPAQLGIIRMDEAAEARADTITIDGNVWHFADVANGNGGYSWVIDTAA